jgi:PPK2 family polyphosphate:nucleotide phosphotransferase
LEPSATRFLKNPANAKDVTCPYGCTIDKRSADQKGQELILSTTLDFTELYRAAPGKPVNLGKIDPSETHGCKFFDDASQETQSLLERMFELQELLYATKKQNLLIVLQGLDTAGKDGVIRHVFRGLNPEGLRVASYKAPSSEELQHDFLWRIHRNAPTKGEIAIFNRSHYEDVLVTRVHGLVPEKVWRQRYGLINDFERLLALENQTLTLKFFLHVSPDEQLARFKVRLDEPGHQWKISSSDYSERKFWREYTEAFEEAITDTSTEIAPWFVIPADHKWYRNLVISQIIVRALESFKLTTPTPNVDVEKIRKEFEIAESELTLEDREQVIKRVEKKERASSDK